MEKTFNQKNYNYFVWTPLGSKVNIYINLCLQVHFYVSAAGYCSHYLPPVLLISVAICHRCRWHRRKTCHGINYQQYQFYQWQNLQPAVDTSGSPWLQISQQIFEKFETTLKFFSGAWGKVIHDKNLKQKPWHCPFKLLVVVLMLWWIGTCFSSEASWVKPILSEAGPDRWEGQPPTVNI